MYYEQQYSNTCAYGSSRLSSQKRKILALHERIAVLDKIKQGRSCRSIAEGLGVYVVSKTQFQGSRGTKRALYSNGKPEVEQRGSRTKLESCATKIGTKLFGSHVFHTGNPTENPSGVFFLEVSQDNPSKTL